MIEIEYCSACGQRRGDYRRSMWWLMGELVRETLELDGRLWRTLRAMVHPGRLTREFNEGRRSRYISPVRLYLFMSVVMFATASISLRINLMLLEPDASAPGVTRVDADAAVHVDDHNAMGRQLKRRLEELEHMPATERDRELFVGALDHGPVVMFFMLPVFAVLLQLFYLGTGRLLVEHLVFSLHVHTLWFLLLVPALALPGRWSALLLLPIPLYTALALHHAYGGPAWATLLRSLGLALTYSFALLLGFAFAVVLAVLLG